MTVLIRNMFEREASFSHLERERESLQARLDGSPERKIGDAVKKGEIIQCYEFMA